MRRLLATTLILAAMSPMAASATEDTYPSVANYAVTRNGQTIGRHTLTFQQQGPLRIVSIDSRASVRMLGITAYRYTHQGREVWNGEQLQSLQAVTDDNGRRSTVRAERRDGRLAVERAAPGTVTMVAASTQGVEQLDANRASMPADIMPTSQWKMRQVRQSKLLNTQDGTLIQVQVKSLGRENVRTGTSTVPATRYAYSGGLQMNQWFDDRGRWVKGSFTAFDGSTIEYTLQE